MKTQILFNAASGPVTNTAMLERLRSIGADDCDVLYIHTDMTFGLPVRGLKRSEIFTALYAVIEALHVKTLVFPTFTFSFCNNDIYDVQKSKTPMGSLNEYIRLHIKGIRTRDPLLSVYVVGDPLNLVDNLGIKSLGENSNYDRLHKCGKDVKFLFFGADMRACFTYTHHIEAMIESPYRYFRSFKGTIVDNGTVHTQQEAELFSTYANCQLGSVPIIYNAMKQAGQLQETPIGDSSFCCFTEADAYATIMQLLADDPYCLTNGKYDPAIKDTSYPDGERIISCL